MVQIADDAVLRSLLGFTRFLRRAGLSVGTEQVHAYTRAVAHLGLSELDNLYWAGRVTLVLGRDELSVYDHAFDLYFRGREAPLEGPPATGFVLKLEVHGELPRTSLSDPGGELREVTGPPRELALTAASPVEVLRNRSFEEYSEQEHAMARAVMARLAARKPRRRSRRTRPATRRGPRPDLPRTLRRALRTEGEPFQRAWRRRRTKPRRLVLVLDVSGSMGAYARSLAGFAHAAVRTGRHVEAFAFGTRLTRITPSLHSHDPDAALAALGQAVPDWEGGTRIGDSLKELLDGWGRRGRRGSLRGAVVVIASDGLDRGDPEFLGEQMRRLSRLAHRVVWVNPLRGSSRYEPLARGMAAALPHCDHFLPGHNLASLETLADVLVQLGS